MIFGPEQGCSISLRPVMQDMERDCSEFGFFAVLPTLYENVSAAIAEAGYALDSLGAEGIKLYTRYGLSNTYLDYPSFTPLGKKLNRRCPHPPNSHRRH